MEKYSLNRETLANPGKQLYNNIEASPPALRDAIASAYSKRVNIKTY